MMKCRFAWRSTRKSILPPLMSLTACATFGVTVPVRGFGIRLRGPRILPRRPTWPIMSGDATAASKSVQPPWIRSTKSSEPTKSAPASTAASALAPVAKTTTRAVLPVPCGRFAVPRTIWSAFRGSTERRIATSTVVSLEDGLIFWARAIASAGAYGRSSTFAAAALYALLRFAICVFSLCSCGVVGPRSALPRDLRSCELVFDGDAHGAGSSGNDLGCGVEVVGIEVTHLGFGNLCCLSRGDRANFNGVWCPRTLRDPSCFLNQLRCRWGFGDEGK